MSKQSKYDPLAQRIMELIGGTENLDIFTHCVTRLRFNVRDTHLVNTDEIEKLPGVLGVQWQGGQLQVIIGQAVGDAYRLICEKYGLNTEKENGSLDGDSKVKEKQNPFMMLLDGISGSITPLLPVLIGGGMIKILLLCCILTGILTEESPTYITLAFAGNAAFYFLPVFIGATAATKFGANMAIGMMLGAILIAPEFVTMVGNGTGGSIFGIPVYAGSYGGSIFPMILTMMAAAPVETFIARRSPQILRSLLEPLLTLLIMTPLMLCLLAPVGAFLGNYLAAAIMWLYNTIGFFAVGIFACLLPLMVLTGMHHGFMPYMIQSFSTYGYEPIVVTGNIISNVNEGAACLAVAAKTKNTDLKTNAISCGITAILGGVTEPAMFGINAKYRTPLIGAMIGGLAGGLIAGIGKAYAYVLPGSWGVLSLPVFIGENMGGVLFMAVGMIVSMLVTFGATFLLYKDEEVQDRHESRGKEDADKQVTYRAGIVLNPVKGEAVPLAEVPDATFAGEILGKGVALKPVEDTIYSPIDGKIVSIFPTKHAIALESIDGIQLLIHVGIDTVKLEGRYFHAFVEEGQIVKAGQRLMECNFDEIQKAGFQIITPIIVANTNDYEEVGSFRLGFAEAGEEIFQVNRRNRTV